MNRSGQRTARFSTLAGVAAFGLSPAALSQTVDFEDVAVASGEGIQVAPMVDSGGYTFYAPTFLMLQRDRLPTMGANGTTTLWGMSDPVSMMATDGSTFDLVSLELGEMNSIFSAATVHITGYYEAGGSVSMSVALDQIYDGPGGAADLEMVLFDAAWSGLVEVITSGTGLFGALSNQYVMDNIEFGGGIADSDGDGVADDVDACPYSDLRLTLHIGDFNTGVANMLFADGCTMADQMAMMLTEDHPGWFLWRMIRTVHDWRGDGLISRRQTWLVMLVSIREWRNIHCPKPKRRRGRRW